VNSKTTVALILPTLNEIEGLKHVVPHIDFSLFHEVIAIDGGSTDGTVEFLRGMNLKVVRQTRRGLQNAILQAVEIAKSDCVIEFSPDGNCKPEYLPQVVSRLQSGSDLVVVSRYLDNASSADDTVITAFGNWMFSRLMGFIGPYRPTDALTIYRGFRVAAFDWLEVRRYLVGPVFEPLITGLSSLHALRVSEMAGDEPSRIGGSTKMRVVYNGSCILYMIMRLIFRRVLK